MIVRDSPMNNEWKILYLKIRNSHLYKFFFPADLGAPQLPVVLEADVYSSYKTSCVSVYICLRCVCGFLLSDVLSSDFTYRS